MSRKHMRVITNQALIDMYYLYIWIRTFVYMLLYAFILATNIDAHMYTQMYIYIYLLRFRCNDWYYCRHYHFQSVLIQENSTLNIYIHISKKYMCRCVHILNLFHLCSYASMEYVSYMDMPSYTYKVYQLTFYILLFTSKIKYIYC